MEQPKRKHPRLAGYDYCENGYYFITICSKDHKEIFSHIRMDAQGTFLGNDLTAMGRIVQTELLALEQRYPCIRIEKYVVMPNHIHAIICVDQEQTIGSKVSVTDAVCAFKSIAAKKCRQVYPIPKVFQDSFHDHVIRDEQDYSVIWAYIDANPQRWREDCFHSNL